MKKRQLLISLFMFIANQMICQTVSDSTITKIYGDINKDNINDTIVLDNTINSFIFRYNRNGGKIERKINFFKHELGWKINMIFSVQKNILSFEMTYGPKYLTKISLHFEYHKLKDDWQLKTIENYLFNPNDSDLMWCNSLYTLKKNVFLLKDNLDPILEKVGYFATIYNTNRYFTSIEYKCDSESDLDINILHDRVLNFTPKIDEPKILRLKLYIEGNPIVKYNLKVYNDIALKLHQTSSNRESLFILKKVVKEFPESIDACLIIADVYWDLGEFAKSNKFYKKYLGLMKLRKKHVKVPKRVYSRIK